jgi:Putative bacterial sensory transduction regulator
VLVNEALDTTALLALGDRVDGWLHSALDENPAMLAVDRGGTDECGPGERRWYVRLHGDEKEFTTVWLTLAQRTLRYETYVIPAPAEHALELYEHVLRRNERLVGAHFSIGMEDAIYLRGEMPVALVSAGEVDRVIGTLFATVEQCFGALVAIAFPHWAAQR